MKVLVLNGSPKGEKSNTLNITKAFLDGFSADTEVEYITVKKETIKPCMGCFFVLEQNTRQMCYKGRYAENLRKD